MHHFVSISFRYDYHPAETHEDIPIVGINGLKLFKEIIFERTSVENPTESSKNRKPTSTPTPGKSSKDPL